MSTLDAFVRSVRHSTDEARVPWEAGAPYEFIARGTSGSLRIASFAGSHPITFELLNPADEVVDRLETQPHRSGPWRDWELDLEALYEQARRQATGVADIVADLTEEFGLKPAPDDDIPF